MLTSTNETGYLWNTGAITKSISVNTTAVYTVKTINKFKCVSATSAAVPVVVNPIPNAPTIQAESDTIFCDGGSVNLKTASTLKITWYPSLELAQKITVNKTGAYIARSTDDRGCTSTPSNAIFVKTRIVPSTPKIVPKGVFSLEAQGAIPGDNLEIE